MSDLIAAEAALDAKEQQVVTRAVSEANGCGYRMVPHSTVAEKMAGVQTHILRVQRIKGGRTDDIAGVGH